MKGAEMEYYELHPITPQMRYINKAVEVLKNGGVIIYPQTQFTDLAATFLTRKL